MRKVTILALILALVMVVSACANDADAPVEAPAEQQEDASDDTDETEAPEEAAPDGERQVVEVWMLSEGIQLTAHIDSFEDFFPQYDLRITYFESEDLKTQTRMAIAGGTAPDVMAVNVGEMLSEFIEAGAALDLTDIFEERGWSENTYEDFLESLGADGRIYAMNYVGAFLWQALYYNADFMDENGIDIPLIMTIEEMSDIAEEIRAAGMQPVAFGNQGMWPGILMFGDYLLQMAPPDYPDAINSGEVGWDESEVIVTVFDALQRMGQGGIFTVGYESQDHTAAIMSWGGELAAMLYNGAWWPGTFDNGIDDIPFTIGTTFLPRYRSGAELQGTQFWGNMALMINADTESVSGAVAFVDHMISWEAAHALAQDMGCITFHPGYNRQAELHPIFLTEPFTAQLPLPKMNYADWIFPTPVTEELKIQIVDLFAGRVTPEEAAANVEAVHAGLR